ncbi:MAG: hypothetical protein M3Y27_10815 [Acidobacteriota bacterium]|nr:hypothetical protein [Acidobacteriota bacterium]
MLWGAVDKNTRVIRLYETGVTPGAQFGSTYLTADFKLPELPVEELVPVLWLILASQSRYIRPIDEKAGRYLTQSAT